jgi:hypothetical protein
MAKRKFIDSEKQKLIEDLLNKIDHKASAIWACELLCVCFLILKKNIQMTIVLGKQSRLVVYE